MGSQDRFEFGKNWSNYIDKHFSIDRIETSSRSLLDSLRLSDLKGKTFLDIGSGSGIHSLAAYRAGAKQIVSFDYDQNSVETTEKLREWAGSPTNWTVMQGSVLDKAFMESLGEFDIVYSWGVLHHTGAMWDAIANARIPLNSNGVFFIALYSHTGYSSGVLSGWPSPKEWLDIKQMYNKRSFLGRCLMELQQFGRSSQCFRAKTVSEFFRRAVTFGKKIQGYSAKRGMSYWYDLRDWLGGWPMEFMKESECIDFCKSDLKLELLRMKTGEGNTEYLFRPKKSSNYWDRVLLERKYYSLNSPLRHEGGLMWSSEISRDCELYDSEGSPKRSPLTLCYEGTPLAYAHSPINSILELGGGRYRHCKDRVFFSYPDNVNPNEQGEAFSYYLDF